MVFENCFERLENNQYGVRSGITLITGSSTSPNAINTAGQIGNAGYYSTKATSGTTYGVYTRLYVTGAGVEAIAGRSRTLVKVAGVANAHGQHDTLELDTSAGSVLGLATGHRANLVLPARAVLGGNYFGAMSEIYIPASGDISGVTKCAIHEFSTGSQDATAEKTIKNAFSFDTGSTGTGNMIYIHAVTLGATGAGSIRVLVNGTAYWIPLVGAE